MKLGIAITITTVALASTAAAKYYMPPIVEVLRTAPIVVDATVVKVDPKTGAVELKVHHEFSGTGAERLVVSKVHLSCTGGAPGHFGATEGQRYVFVLQAPDTLFEGSTFYPVVCDEEKPRNWRVADPRTRAAEGEKKPEIGRLELERLLQKVGN